MIIVQKAVIKKRNKYLVLLRWHKAKFFPLHWDFPGGKLDKGESLKAGIEREVLEETQLKVKALKVVLTYKDVFKGIPHEFYIYSVNILSGKVKISHEHLRFKWATKEEILKLKREPYIDPYFEKYS